MLKIQKLSSAGQPQVLPLLGRCFPDYWEQLATRENRMPFDEISFAAYCDHVLCGHCGVMLYEVADNDGVFRQMGGIASVAVAPEYRGRGIAAQLCQEVIRWAETAPGIISLPLYTALFRVYESVSWTLYPLPQPFFARPQRKIAALKWQCGSELEKNVKEFIISLYESTPVYPGKVRRKNGTEFHSWRRIFADPELSFAATADGYAIKYGDVLAETGFAPGTPAEIKKDFFAAALTPDGADILLPETSVCGMELELSAAHSDPMHGERVLVRDVKNSEFHRKNPGLFFSLADKF